MDSTLCREEEKGTALSILIIEGLAPNFSNPITSTFTGRRGRSCVISHINLGRVGTLSYNSFRWRSIRLFDSLPMQFPRVQFLDSRLNLIPRKRGGSSLPARIEQQPAWWRL